MGKLYSMLSIFSVATLLAVSGLGGYLYATGKLTADRAGLMAAVLRGEHDDLIATDEPEAAAEPEELKPGAASSRAIDQLRNRLEDGRLMNARLERGLNDLQAMHDLLNQATQTIVVRTEALDAQQQDWQDRREKMKDAAKDAGFARELETLSALDTDQAKAHILSVWAKSPPDAARLLTQLAKNKRRDILNAMTGPGETEIMSAMLERMRLLEAEASVPTQGG